MQIRCGKQLLDLSAPRIMGVLNVTPDSFSDGGQCYRGDRLDPALALRKAEQMLAEGAALIDVGGESTRPGATPVGLQQEMDRVLPVVEALVRNTGAIVSVDTSSPALMTEAAHLGAGLINDVRALRREGALEAALATGLPVCLMHMQGEPDIMQQNPRYRDPVSQVVEFLQQRVHACLSGGMDSGRILLDPGFGFGKTLAHNLALLRRLPELARLGYPLLVGLSRKSMLGKLLGREVDQRLPGSLALALVAAQRGAAIIRVHDVAASADLLKVWQALSEDEETDQ